ncbi:kinase-like protein [Marasmius fiardii PR-910]|nr:kinase-like protein [Marasmius fiardii PR-910]
MIQDVEKVGDYAVGGGTFADVWKGKVREVTVCLKVVRVYQTSNVEQLVKEFMVEAIVWQYLKHPNLLPFLGMYYLDKARTQLCLVSLWMEKGNLFRYLKSTPTECVYDVASGLSYLHNEKIVRGDLKGLNVLITPDERACTGDLGLSRVAEAYALTLPASIASQSKGTARYLSPELLMPDQSSTSTRCSDVYAFACVCYEIFTGNVPFYGLNDFMVVVAVLEKKRPPRPESMALLNDGMWNVMVECWDADPSKRPVAEEIFVRVAELENGCRRGRGRIESASSWDRFGFDQIRRNVRYPVLDVASLVRLREGLSVGSSDTTESGVNGSEETSTSLG